MLAVIRSPIRCGSLRIYKTNGPLRQGFFTRPHDGRLDVRLRVVQHRPTWGAKHAGQWAATLRTYAYPKIGEKRVDWITTADVMGVLLPLWQLLRAP